MSAMIQATVHATLQATTNLGSQKMLIRVVEFSLFGGIVTLMAAGVIRLQ